MPTTSERVAAVLTTQCKDMDEDTVEYCSSLVGGEDACFASEEELLEAVQPFFEAAGVEIDHRYLRAVACERFDDSKSDALGGAGHNMSFAEKCVFTQDQIHFPTLSFVVRGVLRRRPTE